MQELAEDQSVDFHDDMELMVGFQDFYNNKMSRPGTMKAIIDRANRTMLSRKSTSFKIKNSRLLTPSPQAPLQKHEGVQIDSDEFDAVVREETEEEENRPVLHHHGLDLGLPLQPVLLGSGEVS